MDKKCNDLSLNVKCKVFQSSAKVFLRASVVEEEASGVRDESSEVMASIY